MSKKPDIFFHFHPKDEKHFDKLFKHLPRTIRKSQICNIVHPGLLSTGESILEKSKVWLQQCQLFIPLSSAEYWGTDLGETNFVPIHDQAMELKNMGKIQLSPILLQEHLDANEVYEDIQVWPKKDKPLSSIDDKSELDETLNKIAKEIREKVQNLLVPQEDKSEMIQLFQESLFRLNYRDQKEKVYDHYQELQEDFQRLQITFLQGTPNCGHNLLINILRREYQIEMETEPQPIPLELTNLKPPALWRELKLALLQENVPYNKPKEIAQNINERLQLEHIVLRFENFGQCKGNAVLQCIRDFWFELNHQLEKANPEKPPYSLFIFILDRSLAFRYSLDDFKHPKASEAHKKILQLLPIISPVTQEEFNKWVEILFDAEGLKYRPLYYKLCGCSPSIIPEEESDGVYVKNAIEKMATFLELEAYKSDIIESLKL